MLSMMTKSVLQLAEPVPDHAEVVANTITSPTFHPVASVTYTEVVTPAVSADSMTVCRTLDAPFSV
jgi:hypothetical protein